MRGGNSSTSAAACGPYSAVDASIRSSRIQRLTRTGRRWRQYRRARISGRREAPAASSARTRSRSPTVPLRGMSAHLDRGPLNRSQRRHSGTARRHPISVRRTTSQELSNDRRLRRSNCTCAVRWIGEHRHRRAAGGCRVAPDSRAPSSHEKAGTYRMTERIIPPSITGLRPTRSESQPKKHVTACG